MQILKKPEATSFTFWPEKKNSQARIPYKHYLHRFDSPEQLESKAVFSLYTASLGQCRRDLGIAEDDHNTMCPHNVMLTKEWMIVLPRRSNDYQGVGANAAGMMGLPMMSTEETMQKWIDAGPANVLANLGVASA